MGFWFLDVIIYIQAIRVRNRNTFIANRGSREHTKEDWNQPERQSHIFPVREHGCCGEEAEGDGDCVRADDGGGRRDPCRPNLLSRPWWLHDGDMQLWQPARRPFGRRDGPVVLSGKPSDDAAAENPGCQSIEGDFVRSSANNNKTIGSVFCS